MVVVNCPICHKRRLLGLESIITVGSTDAGMTVDFYCSCGGRGTMIMGNRPGALSV